MVTLEDLRAYLDGKFGALEARLDAMEGRLDAIEGRLDAHDGHFGRLEEGIRHLGVRLEALQRDVYAVVEGHQLLYEGMLRRHEEVRKDMDDLRALLKLWNDLVTRRLRAFEDRLDSLTA